MNLEAFQRCVRDEVRAQASRIVEDAERDAHRDLRRARRQAEQRRERARERGREIADHELHRRRAAARRHARQQVLRAQREAFEQLSERVHHLLEGQRDHETGRDLLDRLARLAEQQLGSDARIEPEPQGRGLMAYADGRQVDYRFIRLVERELRSLGTEVERLWR
ncbi:MAG: V-type ATP synthase subunit E family protein [Nitriliruptoraceae bacterium]